MKIHKLLNELDACGEAQEWASTRTWKQIYNECHRGDWLCWLFARTNPNDIQLLTLVKGHQANTVRHLMKDERSLAAVDAAIAFGEGRITVEELKEAAAKAKAAKSSLHPAINKDVATTYIAYFAVEVHANASSVANYIVRYTTDESGSKQQETADIFRKLIKITDFKV